MKKIILLFMCIFANSYLQGCDLETKRNAETEEIEKVYKAQYQYWLNSYYTKIESPVERKKVLDRIINLIGECKKHQKKMNGISGRLCRVMDKLFKLYDDHNDPILNDFQKLNDQIFELDTFQLQVFNALDLKIVIANYEDLCSLRDNIDKEIEASNKKAKPVSSRRLFVNNNNSNDLDGDVVDRPQRISPLDDQMLLLDQRN